MLFSRGDGVINVHLDHIAVIVSNEDSIQFYKKFGFTEIKRIVRSKDTIVFLKCDELIIEMFIDPAHPSRLSEPESKGLRHIAIVVDSLEDVDVDLCENRMDWFGRRSCMIKDPDGQPIEVIEEKE